MQNQTAKASGRMQLQEPTLAASTLHQVAMLQPSAVSPAETTQDVATQRLKPVLDSRNVAQTGPQGREMTLGTACKNHANLNQHEVLRAQQNGRQTFGQPSLVSSHVPPRSAKQSAQASRDIAKMQHVMASGRASPDFMKGTHQKQSPTKTQPSQIIQCHAPFDNASLAIEGQQIQASPSPGKGKSSSLHAYEKVEARRKPGLHLKIGAAKKDGKATVRRSSRIRGFQSSEAVEDDLDPAGRQAERHLNITAAAASIGNVHTEQGSHSPMIFSQYNRYGTAEMCSPSSVALGLQARSSNVSSQQQPPEAAPHQRPESSLSPNQQHSAAGTTQNRSVIPARDIRFDEHSPMTQVESKHLKSTLVEQVQVSRNKKTVLKYPAAAKRQENSRNNMVLADTKARTNQLPQSSHDEELDDAIDSETSPRLPETGESRKVIDNVQEKIRLSSPLRALHQSSQFIVVTDGQAQRSWAKPKPTGGKERAKNQAVSSEFSLKLRNSGEDLTNRLHVETATLMRRSHGSVSSGPHGRSNSPEGHQRSVQRAQQVIKLKAGSMLAKIQQVQAEKQAQRRAAGRAHRQLSVDQTYQKLSVSSPMNSVLLPARPTGGAPLHEAGVLAQKLLQRLNRATNIQAAQQPMTFYLMKAEDAHSSLTPMDLQQPPQFVLVAHQVSTEENSRVPQGSARGTGSRDTAGIGGELTVDQQGVVATEAETLKKSAKSRQSHSRGANRRHATNATPLPHQEDALAQIGRGPEDSIIQDLLASSQFNTRSNIPPVSILSPEDSKHDALQSRHVTSTKRQGTDVESMVEHGTGRELSKNESQEQPAGSQDRASRSTPLRPTELQTGGDFNTRGTEVESKTPINTNYQLDHIDFSAEYRIPAHGPATGKLAQRHQNIDDLIKSPVSTRAGDPSTTHIPSGGVSFANQSANWERKPQTADNPHGRRGKSRANRLPNNYHQTQINQVGAQPLGAGDIFSQGQLLGVRPVGGMLHQQNIALQEIRSIQIGSRNANRVMSQQGAPSSSDATAAHTGAGSRAGTNYRNSRQLKSQPAIFRMRGRQHGSQQGVAGRAKSRLTGGLSPPMMGARFGLLNHTAPGSNYGTRAESVVSSDGAAEKVANAITLTVHAADHVPQEVYELSFSEAFKKSFAFLENFDANDIRARLFTRDGSIRQDGRPFFLDQMLKERRIRENRTHKLRTGSDASLDLSNIRGNVKPIKRGYVHHRLTTNERHYEKCKRRLMTFFEAQMVQARKEHIQNHQHMLNIAIMQAEQDHRETQMTLMNYLAEQPTVGGDPNGETDLHATLKLHAAENATRDANTSPFFQSTMAGEQSKGDVVQRDMGTGISLGPELCGYKDIASTPEPMKQSNGERESSRLNRTGGIQTREIVATNPNSNGKPFATPFNGAISNVDPGSAAVPSSANIKIVQRMYSDGSNESLSHELRHREGYQLTPGSVKSGPSSRSPGRRFGATDYGTQSMVHQIIPQDAIERSRESALREKRQLTDKERKVQDNLQSHLNVKTNGLIMDLPKHTSLEKRSTHDSRLASKKSSLRPTEPASACKDDSSMMRKTEDVTRPPPLDEGAQKQQRSIEEQVREKVQKVNESRLSKSRGQSEHVGHRSTISRKDGTSQMSDMRGAAQKSESQGEPSAVQELRAMQKFYKIPSQSKVFEDFMDQTAKPDVRNPNYMPIQARVQRLQNIMARRRSSTGDQSSTRRGDLLAQQFHLYRHRLAKLQGAITNQRRLQQLQSLKLAAQAEDDGKLSELLIKTASSKGQCKMYIAPVRQQQHKLNLNDQKDKGTGLCFDEQNLIQQKPLWNVKKTVSSNVINQRTYEGWQTSKMSAGDPYRLHRLIFDQKPDAPVQRGPMRQEIIAAQLESVLTRKLEAGEPIALKQDERGLYAESDYGRLYLVQNNSLESIKDDQSGETTLDLVKGINIKRKKQLDASIATTTNGSLEKQRCNYGMKELKVGVNPGYIKNAKKCLAKDKAERNFENEFMTMQSIKAQLPQDRSSMEGRTDETPVGPMNSSVYRVSPSLMPGATWEEPPDYPFGLKNTNVQSSVVISGGQIAQSQTAGETSLGGDVRNSFGDPDKGPFMIQEVFAGSSQRDTLDRSLGYEGRRDQGTAANYNPVTDGDVCDVVAPTEDPSPADPKHGTGASSPSKRQPLRLQQKTVMPHVKHTDSIINDENKRNEDLLLVDSKGESKHFEITVGEPAGPGDADDENGQAARGDHDELSPTLSPELIPKWRSKDKDQLPATPSAGDLRDGPNMQVVDRLAKTPDTFEGAFEGHQHAHVATQRLDELTLNAAVPSDLQPGAPFGPEADGLELNERTTSDAFGASRIGSTRMGTGRHARTFTSPPAVIAKTETSQEGRLPSTRVYREMKIATGGFRIHTLHLQANPNTFSHKKQLLAPYVSPKSRDVRHAAAQQTDTPLIDRTAVATYRQTDANLPVATQGSAGHDVEAEKAGLVQLEVELNEGLQQESQDEAGTSGPSIIHVDRRRKSNTSITVIDVGRAKSSQDRHSAASQELIQGALLTAKGSALRASAESGSTRPAPRYLKKKAEVLPSPHSQTNEAGATSQRSNVNKNVKKVQRGGTVRQSRDSGTGTNETLAEQACRNDSAFDRQLNAKARSTLATQMRQPIHRKPPEYLQRNSFGTRFQFGVPAHRRNHQVLQMHAAAVTASYMQTSTSAMSWRDGHGQPRSSYDYSHLRQWADASMLTQAEGSAREHVMNAAARIVSSQRASTCTAGKLNNEHDSGVLSEATKLGDVPLNIRQLRREASRLKRCQLALQTGVETKRLAVLRPRGVVPKGTGNEADVNFKSERFYSSQLHNAPCRKAKKHIDQRIDPQYKVEQQDAQIGEQGVTANSLQFSMYSTQPAHRRAATNFSGAAEDVQRIKMVDQSKTASELAFMEHPLSPHFTAASKAAFDLNATFSRQEHRVKGRVSPPEDPMKDKVPMRVDVGASLQSRAGARRPCDASKTGSLDSMPSHARDDTARSPVAGFANASRPFDAHHVLRPTLNENARVAVQLREQNKSEPPRYATINSKDRDDDAASLRTHSSPSRPDVGVRTASLVGTQKAGSSPRHSIALATAAGGLNGSKPPSVNTRVVELVNLDTFEAIPLTGDKPKTAGAAVKGGSTSPPLVRDLMRQRLAARNRQKKTDALSQPSGKMKDLSEQPEYRPLRGFPQRPQLKQNKDEQKPKKF